MRVCEVTLGVRSGRERLRMEPWGNLLIELRKSRQENVEKIQENPIMGSNRGESCYGVVSINKGGECSSADR